MPNDTAPAQWDGRAENPDTSDKSVVRELALLPICFQDCGETPCRCQNARAFWWAIACERNALRAALAEADQRTQAAAAAAWLAAREACVEAVNPVLVGHMDVVGVALINAVVRLRGLPPPADAAAALAEVVRRAKEEEREALIAWIKKKQESRPDMSGAYDAFDAAGDAYEHAQDEIIAAIRARDTEGGA